jgi:hypothetical protein
MSSFQKFIHEIHRRSLWQVLEGFETYSPESLSLNDRDRHFQERVTKWPTFWTAFGLR